MRVEDYAKYINVLHDLAYVEDDLRDVARHEDRYGANAVGVARFILFERFGVDV